MTRREVVAKLLAGFAREVSAWLATRAPEGD